MGISRVSRYLSVPLALALALLLLAGVAPLPVRAASFAVTVDMNDANSPGGNSDVLDLGGNCAMSGTAPCSLRDAVIFANTRPDPTDTTTITLPAGTYTLTRTGRGETSGYTGDLDLHGNVTIVGGGASTTIVQASPTGSASGIDRVFAVGSGGYVGTVTISGVTIRYGNATGTDFGGGIAVLQSGSTLTLNDCVVADNLATSGDGDGIYVRSGATLITNRTTIRDNRGGFVGGGIYNNGTVTMTNSTLSGNHADGGGGGGGGIFNNGISTLVVMNSTLSGNHADGPSGGGGGIYNVGTLTAINTLIAGNTAAGSGGIDPDVRGPFAPGSKNTLIGDGTGATGITNGANGNLVGTSANPIIPLLDPTLRDNDTINGTQTLALLPGSPAINAGDDATCVNTSGTAPVAGLDQRGVARPQPPGGRCDIGAFEFVFTTTVALAASPNPATVGQSVTFTAAVTGTGSGTPTGSVTFKDGTTTLGFASLSSGVASFIAVGLTAGSHAITAVYGGDAVTFPPATSAVLTQVVGSGGGAPTTTALSSSANPSTVGQSVTFTATVSGAGGTPTGTVTFQEGAAPLGPPVALSGGTAIFTTSTLAAGSHALTAVYSGDASFASSTAAPLVQVVSSGGGGGTTSGLQYFALSAPVRLLDTRGLHAFRNAPTLTTGQTLNLPGRFSFDGVTVPAAAVALVGNATVDNSVSPVPAGFATLYPSGGALPLASNLNFVPGTVRPNAFTVGLGADGSFTLYSSSGGNFIIDVTGYYAPPAAGGLFFHPLPQPVRALDTRSGASAFLHPNAPLAAGQTVSLPGSFLFNGITVPSGAVALAGNATVDNSGAPVGAGFATLYPGGQSLPATSTLNFVPGTVAPNAFTVGIGGGSYTLYSSSGGNFVVDITGYYDTNGAGGLAFYPLTQPVREVDTRGGASAFVHPNAPLAAGQKLNLPGVFSFSGIGVPAGAVALLGNATVDNSVAPVGAGFATVYPSGAALPLASNLNYVPGTVAPNAFIVGIGSDGTYVLYASSGGNFVVDITGYFAAGAGTSAAPAGSKAASTTTPGVGGSKPTLPPPPR